MGSESSTGSPALKVRTQLSDSKQLSLLVRACWGDTTDESGACQSVSDHWPSNSARSAKECDWHDQRLRPDQNLRLGGEFLG